MTVYSFLVATALLLMTPGPTNTLLAVASAERGFTDGVSLVKYEMAAYFMVVFPLALLSNELASTVYSFREYVAIAAAAWVAVLSVKMWKQYRSSSNDGAKGVTGRLVFLTTLLNPKAFIIGLVMMPNGSYLAKSVALGLLIFAAACLWSGLGSILMVHSKDSARITRQISSVILALLSFALLTSGLRLG